MIFWRHGRTQWNRVGRFQGHEDVALDEVGRAQAAGAAPFVAGLGFDAIVASDLQRARDTAQEVATLTGRAVRTDRRLRETFLGPWQGLTGPQARERFPAEYADWIAGRQRPSVEPRTAVGERVVAALADVAADQVLVVSHGGAIRSALCTLLGLRQQDWDVLSPLGNCRWSIAELAGARWALEQHNAGPDIVPDDHGTTAHDAAPTPAERRAASPVRSTTARPAEGPLRRRLG